jgi:hypothetical protein
MNTKLPTLTLAALLMCGMALTACQKKDATGAAPNTATTPSVNTPPPASSTTAPAASDALQTQPPAVAASGAASAAP